MTVITPTFNRARFLDETIDSVLAQTYPRIEYIVLDDGSTDNTQEILQGYEGRLQTYTHPNMGETRTVNKGWQLAKGKYVFTVNSDDPVCPELVATAVQFMEDRPDVLAAYPDWVIIDEHSRPTQPITTAEYDYATMVAWHHCMPGPGTIMRRQAFERLGLRDPRFRYVADYEYWLRLGLHGRMARIPQTLATWRTHATNLTTTARGRLMAAEHIAVIRRLFRRANLPEVVRKFHRQALATAYFVAGLTTAPAARWQAQRYLLRALLYCPMKSLSYPPTGLTLPWAVLRQNLLLHDMPRAADHLEAMLRSGAHTARRLLQRIAA
ncbi:hypothetical protein AYO44_13585 [Planctomycetaceae bacterium SCGC AG-212-F19]|nr:hypothetical protein AYO44_13585 [Planctomycetaceae bacterium SCGC AG-212-F19]